MIFIVQFFLKLLSQKKKKEKRSETNPEYPKLQHVAGVSERWALLEVCLLCVYMSGLGESGGLFENRLTSIVDASHRYLGWL